MAEENIKNEVEVIEVDMPNVTNIELEEIFATVDEANNALNHALLHNREIQDQHPITAITGLREELDTIESLQTIYSDKRQHANYYMWDDGNVLSENRDGFFISICGETNHLKICDGTSDVFGVTVADAAFVGGQEYAKADDGTKVGRDRKYGLVVHSGLAGVRRESNVVVGDYVVPNSRGEAEKSHGNYGYLVTALSEVNGVSYAIISLVAPFTLAKQNSDNVNDLSRRMSNAEYNITSVTNVANSAYALALDAKENAEVSSEYIEEKVEEVLGKMDAVDWVVGNLSESVNVALTDAAMAKVIANGAVNSANAMKDAAVNSANEATAKVNGLIDDLKPITTWTDPYNSENKGAHYFTEYITDGLNTKVDIETFESQTEEAFSAIERNAKSLTSLMSTIGKYAVGEYSQAYGLTIEQAKSILQEGCVYVPTVVHTETYGSSSQQFTISKVNDTMLGYYYTWTDEGWVPSVSTTVNFSSAHILGTNEDSYWVVTIADVVDNNGITYDLGGLYHWEKVSENWKWVKVASVADNTLSRAVSAIKQTADSITIDVTNMKGDVAESKQWITDNDVNIQQVVSWKSTVEDDVSNIATIKQTADDAGASIAQVAAKICGEYETLTVAWNETGKNTSNVYYTTVDKKYHYHEDGQWKETDYPTEAGLEVNAASIVTAVVGNETAISLLADEINLRANEIDLTGYVTFTSLQNSGETTINGDNITTGTIDASKVTVTNLQAQSIITTGNTTLENELNNTLVSSQVYYALWNSVETAPTYTEYETDPDVVATDKWSIKAPVWTDGSHMWQRTVNTYRDGDVRTSTTCIAGAKGSGVTVKSIQYQSGSSSTTAPTGAWKDTVVSVSAGYYLWTKITYSDNSVAYSVARQGNNGTSRYVWVKYADDDKGTNMSDNPSGKSYIGIAHNKTTSSEGTDASDYTWSLLQGDSGSCIEFVYCPSNSNTAPSTPSYTNNALSSGWYPSPQGVSSTSQYEYVSIRTKDAGSDRWNDFSAPALWSKWGEDGDGIEYWYCLSETDQTANINNGTFKYVANSASWTDEPTGVSAEKQYEYVVQIKIIEGQTSTPSKPSLWAKYGDSITVKSVEYQAHTNGTQVPTGTWQATIPSVDEGSYLWTRMEYSDGTYAYSVAKQGESIEGNGVDSTSVYYALSDSNISAPSVLQNGNLDTTTWKTEFPSWASAEQYATSPYAWKLTVTTYTKKSDIDYDVTLMNRLDAANLALAKYNNEHNPDITLGEWCLLMKTSIMEGSAIAAGTITSDRLDVNELSAISANMGTVTAGEIRSENYQQKEMYIWIWNNNKNEWEKRIDKLLFTPVATHLEAGLYDENDVLVKSWNELVDKNGSYKMNCAIPYTLQTYKTQEGSPYNVLQSFLESDQNKKFKLIIADDSNINIIGSNAFRDCSSLTSITIPDSVTSIGSNAFYNCNQLTSVTISNSVNSIGDAAFYNCSSLTSITIPDSVTSIGNSVFYGCESLTRATIDASITAISNAMFMSCSALENIIILNDTITDINYNAFSNCGALKNVYYIGTSNQWDQITINGNNTNLKDAIKYYYSPTQPTDINNNYWYYDDNNGFRLSTTDDNMIDSRYFKVTQDGKITATSGEIGGLEITEQTIQTEGYGNLGIALNNVSEGLSYSSLNSVAKVQPLSSTLDVTELIIPGVDNGNRVQEIAEKAFSSSNDGNLTFSTLLPNVKKIIIPSTIVSIGFSAFRNSPMTDLIINASMSGTLGNFIFAGCSNLTNVTFSDSVKQIGGMMFQNCAALKNIIIPNSVTSIGAYAFRNCTNLESVILSDSITVIPAGCFFGCSKLTNIIIPSSVTTVALDAFATNGQDTLNVYYTGTPDEWSSLINSISENTNNDVLKSANVHYYNDSVDAISSSGLNYWTNATGFKISSNGNMIDSKYFKVTKDGRITATSGEIGSLTLQDGNLVSDNFRLETALDQDGKQKTQFILNTIDTQTIISDSRIEATVLKATNLDIANEISISGYTTLIKNSIKSGDTSLTLNSGSTSTTYYAKLFRGPSSGAIRYFTIRIYSDSTCKTPATLPNTKTFKIKCYFNDTGANNPYNKGTITVLGGTSEGTSNAFNSVLGFSNNDESAFIYTVNEDGTETRYYMDETYSFTVNNNLNIQCTGNFIPDRSSNVSNKQYKLGLDSVRWSYIYGIQCDVTSCTCQSDQKFKDKIIDIDTNFSKQLINGLHPKSYIFKTAITPRTHYGFIAQDVEDLLISLGTSADEVGLVIKSKPGEPDSEDNHYSLNYIDLMAHMVNVIQQLNKRVETLEAQQNDYSSSNQEDCSSNE